MGLLRTILALTVVFAHSPWNSGYVFVGGRNAVQLFYVISGFLIFYVISNNKSYNNPFTFYKSRALRIFPIYFAVALLTLFLALAGLRHEFFDVYGNAPVTANILLVLSNLCIIGQDWVMFLGINNGELGFAVNFQESEVLLYKGLLIPQAWTLGVELTFYAIAPFILRKPSLIISLLIISLVVRAFLIYLGIGLKDPWTYRFFPSELSLFLLGSLSCHYLLPIWKKFISVKGREVFPKVFTWFLVGGISLYFVIPGGEILKSLFLFSIFLIFVPLTFLYQSSSKIDQSIGELSYPIYIGHILIINAVNPLLKITYPQLSQFIISLLYVFLSCVFAYILNKLISARIEKLRTKIKTKPA